MSEKTNRSFNKENSYSRNCHCLH